MQMHFVHGELEPDGSLTLRATADGKYTVNRNVASFDVSVTDTGHGIEVRLDFKVAPPHGPPTAYTVDAKPEAK